MSRAAGSGEGLVPVLPSVTRSLGGAGAKGLDRRCGGADGEKDVGDDVATGAAVNSGVEVQVFSRFLFRVE